MFLATIAGGEVPTVRIVTKHNMTAKPAPEDGSGVHVLEIPNNGGELAATM
jgi:hypothetical protein